MNVDVNGERTLYDILGVPQTATTAEIREAYRKLAQTHHPDSGGDEETFKLINGAHTLLKDSHARAQYDAELAVMASLDEAELTDLLMDSEAPDWDASATSSTDPLWFRASDTLPGDLRVWAAPTGAAKSAGGLMMKAGASAAVVILLLLAYLLLG